MNVLVVYETNFGNTKKAAENIAEGMKEVEQLKTEDWFPYMDIVIGIVMIAIIVLGVIAFIIFRRWKLRRT